MAKLASLQGDLGRPTHLPGEGQRDDETLLRQVPHAVTGEVERVDAARVELGSAVEGKRAGTRREEGVTTPGEIEMAYVLFDDSVGETSDRTQGVAQLVRGHLGNHVYLAVHDVNGVASSNTDVARR